ncbi:MAG: hypothetical protein ABIA04_09045 [Pseudomonadota bacterium]
MKQKFCVYFLFISILLTFPNIIFSQTPIPKFGDVSALQDELASFNNDKLERLQKILKEYDVMNRAEVDDSMISQFAKMAQLKENTGSEMANVLVFILNNRQAPFSYQSKIAIIEALGAFENAHEESFWQLASFFTWEKMDPEEKVRERAIIAFLKAKFFGPEKKDKILIILDRSIEDNSAKAQKAIFRALFEVDFIFPEEALHIMKLNERFVKEGSSYKYYLNKIKKKAENRLVPTSVALCLNLF